MPDAMAGNQVDGRTDARCDVAADVGIGPLLTRASSRLELEERQSGMPESMDKPAVRWTRLFGTRIWQWIQGFGKVAAHNVQNVKSHSATVSAHYQTTFSRAKLWDRKRPSDPGERVAVTSRADSEQKTGVKLKPAYRGPRRPPNIDGIGPNRSQATRYGPSSMGDS